ncbi:superoxide dismutase [Nocardia amamiensis]|uniref:superoxide dismutase n=1 Tax=Nocardia amamiensis TaxID=404578 RepID=UPI003402D8DA
MTELSRRTVLAGALLAAAGVAAAGAPARADGGSSGRVHDRIALPGGITPEGIATGPGPYAYVSDFTSGRIYRADLRTGEGEIISDDPQATLSTGLKTDRYGRLFACGGLEGYARVIDTATGEVLARYQLGEAGTSLINDVLLTDDVAYLTDSRQQALHTLPLHGKDLPSPDEATTVPITGDFTYTAGQNANGITRTPNGMALLIVQSDTGRLFRVDPRTGHSTQVDLGGETLVFGDGMYLHDTTLYVVQSFMNSLFKLSIAPDGRSGHLLETFTGDTFEGSAAVTAYLDRLCLPGKRWATDETWIQLIPRP